jgi:hypothetical protein
MAINSDLQNPDSSLYVTFYKRAVEIADETAAQGRPIYRECDFVRIMIPGNSLSEIDTIAREDHKNRFPVQWARYINTQGEASQEQGTPITEWPLVSVSQAEELRGLKFYTVESIANASDLAVQKIGMAAGMSPYEFRNKAKAFLNLASETAEASKKDEQITHLQEENAKIRAETDAKLAQMQEQMAAILAAVGEKKPKARKAKVVEEA